MKLTRKLTRVSGALIRYIAVREGNSHVERLGVGVDAGPGQVIVVALGQSAVGCRGSELDGSSASSGGEKRGETHLDLY